jgi:hypothetical protein
MTTMIRRKRKTDAQYIAPIVQIFSALTAFAFLVDERGLLRWQVRSSKRHLSPYFLRAFFRSLTGLPYP